MFRLLSGKLMARLGQCDRGVIVIIEYSRISSECQLTSLPFLLAQVCCVYSYRCSLVDFELAFCIVALISCSVLATSCSSRSLVL